MTAMTKIRTHGEEVEVTVHALLHAHNGIDWRIMFRDARYEALEQHRTDGAESKVQVLSLGCTGEHALRGRIEVAG